MPETTQVPLDKLDPTEVWEPWKPDAASPWDLKRAGHLYRRAAFGARWTELQRAVKDGPEETIDRLFSGNEGRAAFDDAMDDLPAAANPYDPSDPRGDELQAWWLHRMCGTLHPLQERLTLFWHNHFATSITKVRQPALMKKQNQLIRKHALGKFRPLVLDMSRDPAMLVWLDSNSNVKGRPNENYARELMELFTLGVGNYTEKDVREAARAFTGWHTTQQEFERPGRVRGPDFRFDRFAHDDGPKTVLGQTGPWDGGDVVRIVLDQPAAACFVVRKLYRHFVSEAETPPDALLEPLAEQFRKSDYDIAVLMRTLLGSRHFFSGYAYRQRVKSPVEYLVGMLRSLEVDLRGASMVSLPVPMDGLGQTLFAPPNVKGWEGGKAWLNSATLLARHNTAWRLVQGVGGPFGAKVNPAALALKYGDRTDYAKQVDFLLALLLQPQTNATLDSARQRLLEFLAKDKPKGGALERRLRETTHAILLMPEYQLA